MDHSTPTSLEELLKTAEDATTAPKEPDGGIPKQKLPSWLRITIKCLCLPFLYMELTTERVAKWIIRPPFKQVGTCKRRGNCCHYILFPETHGIVKKIFTFWNTEVNGFYRREQLNYEYEGKKVLVMGCRYLQKNGSCSNHTFRPKVCRTWPIIEYFGYPKVLKGCGYQAKLRKSAEKKYPALRILEENDE